MPAGAQGLTQFAALLALLGQRRALGLSRGQEHLLEDGELRLGHRWRSERAVSRRTGRRRHGTRARGAGHSRAPSHRPRAAW